MDFNNHAQRSNLPHNLDVDSPFKKDLKLKEKSLNADKPEPLEKAQEPNETKKVSSLWK